MNAWVVRRLDAPDVIERATEFVAVFAEVYREPPYNEGEEQFAGFARHLPGQAERPGFAMVIAEAPAGELIGFAFGTTFPPDQWWPGAGDEPEQLRGHARFGIMELLVRPQWRGRKIGSALMDLLLADRPESYGALATNPQALATAIYRAWGWTSAGWFHPPHADPMEILVKPLHA